jgi:hypothetical protein
MKRFKPPCGLLMLRVINPAHKRLSLSGFLISKNYIYHSGRTIRLWASGADASKINNLQVPASVQADEQSRALE